MSSRTYLLEDGLTICVTVEVNMWSAWLQGDPESQVVGFPLEGVLMEVFGLDPAHQDVPRTVARLANRIRADIPRGEWPDETAWRRNGDFC
jgi:hypothetical protein